MAEKIVQSVALLPITYEHVHDHGCHSPSSMSSIPSTPMSPYFSTRPYAPSSRRRTILAACTILSILSIIFVASTLISRPIVIDSVPTTSLPVDSAVRVSDRKAALRGPPTARYKDNLRNDTQYITSWISAGWTNDVMTYSNLIYLGLITERIPIVGPWIPSHTGHDTDPIPFGEVFDLDYLSNAIGIPVLEWNDVKDHSSTEMEDIGCWSVWHAVQTNEDRPRVTYADSLQKLDISWTTAPVSIMKTPGYEHDPTALFWSVAELTYPDKRAQSLQPASPSELHGAVLPPDEHLACFDYLYYMAASTSFEYEWEHSPAWRFVMRHMRWTDRLQNITNGYLNRIFGTPEDGPVPPYIAIHARHGDFKYYCGELPVEECFASMAVYARRVSEIQEEAEERFGVVPERVIVLSDEKDPEWWDSVREMGWYLVEPEISAEITSKYNSWYPVFVDAIIQSSGMGFIGTDSSTMSVIARRRVQDWHNGIVKTVKWGRPGADDH